MRYPETMRAKFIERPNRFIARAELDGEEVVCHVKNTGRRLEILTAFGLLDGSSPTRDQIVNESIRLYFMQIYNRYSERADANDFVLRMMEEVIS
ncbi:MAG: hypothetical protein PWR17_294 [Candidatus Methanomethylophilaceae archaeon]|nr:hypothetical protein [Candidatus Methanomethylophilaceae archaeon]